MKIIFRRPKDITKREWGETLTVLSVVFVLLSLIIMWLAISNDDIGIAIGGVALLVTAFCCCVLAAS
jgi:hypothetical protein